MRAILVTVVLFLSFKAYSQKEIDLADVSKHVGDSVKIEAKIFGGKYLESAKGMPTFLNVGDNYPNAPLTLIIWNDVRSKFENQPIEEFYSGKRVIIYGVLKTYKNKLEIEIRDPKQLLETAKIDVK